MLRCVGGGHRDVERSRRSLYNAAGSRGLDMAIGKAVQAIDALLRGHGRGVDGGPPTSVGRFRACMAQLGLVAPQAVGELYALVDGLQVGDYRLLSLDEVYATEDGWLVLHDWGTGDVDCVVCGADARFPEGAVVFIGHDPPAEFLVAESIAEWILMLGIEQAIYGEIAHPAECPGGARGRTYRSE